MGLQKLTKFKAILVFNFLIMFIIESISILVLKKAHLLVWLISTTGVISYFIDYIQHKEH